jgi:FkbM family methyltransferase
VILDTRRLFLRLLSTLDIEVACDVGSLNGADALRFRAARPDADIFAFEANPVNERRMRASATLGRARIDIVPLAICERDGDADFFVVDATDGPLARQGMSSLYARTPVEHRGVAVRVACARLDGFLAPRVARAARIALWIDVEGKAFEALRGAEGILDRVALIHVEVETEPCIGEAQKLLPDVHALLDANGFQSLGTDQAPSSIQFNALYVRRVLGVAHAPAIAAARGAAFLRHATRRTVLRLMPARLRNYLRHRRAAPLDVPVDA